MHDMPVRKFARKNMVLRQFFPPECTLPNVGVKVSAFRTEAIIYALDDLSASLTLSSPCSSQHEQREFGACEKPVKCRCPRAVSVKLSLSAGYSDLAREILSWCTQPCQISAAQAVLVVCFILY